VHPVGGDVRCYYDLARNPVLNRPVYAMRARGMDGLLEPHQSMDELVGDYLESIRQVQAKGPYHLAGWSTGGIFAYEMARRLAEEGERTGLLALFDSPMPSIFQNVDLGDDARFLFDLVNFTNWFAGAEMSVSYEELRALDPQQGLETALREAKRHRVVPADVSTDHIRQLIDVCKTHVRIVMNYTPIPFPQHLYIFRPADTTALAEASGQSLEKDLGWGSVVGGQLTLREVPGNHFTMMTGENANGLAEVLSDCLKRARA
jgi:thioesterase domain-containing protein